MAKFLEDNFETIYHVGIGIMIGMFSQYIFVILWAVCQK